MLIRETPVAVVEALKRISTPTLSNAIELCNVRPRNQGFMSPEIHCLFPDLGIMAGHAVTARFDLDQLARLFESE